MKYLTIILFLGLTFAQTRPPGIGGVANIIGPRGDNVPTSCSRDGMLFYRTGATDPGIYVCQNGSYSRVVNASSSGTLSIGYAVITACGGTDDTALIQAAMDVYGSVKLPTGTCVVSNLVTTRATTLRGDGPNTLLSFKSGSTGWLLDGSGFSLRLSDLVLDGGLSLTQASTVSAGTRSGIYISALTRNSGISSAVVRGFSNIGIGLVGDSSHKDATPVISNVNAYYNYIGIDTRVGASGTGSEYLRITGCSVTENRYGINVKSGNLAISGNTFTDNGYGVSILLDANGGHGSLTGNTINHSVVSSLYIADLSTGYSITGNNIWYGDINVASANRATIIANNINVTNIILGNGVGNVFALNTLLGNSNIYSANSGWDIYNNPMSGAYALGAKTIATAPQYTAGSDLVVNGGFADSTSWSPAANWTIGGGVASTNGAGYLQQTLSGLVVGMYKITYTISGYTSGTLYVGVGGVGLTLGRSANGTYSEYFYRSGGNQVLYLSAGAGSIYSIDDVSVVALTAINTSTPPTSSDGLPSGSVWVDTGAGNVLKIVM